MNPTDLQYAAGWRLVRLLPERVAHAVFRLGADLAVRRNGPGVRQLRANLARLGAAHRVRDGMRSYARYWCETFRLSAADGPRMLAAVALGRAFVGFQGGHRRRISRSLSISASVASNIGGALRTRLRAYARQPAHSSR